MTNTEAMLKSYRAYDYRGVYPNEINAEIVYASARAFVRFTSAKTMLIGRDARSMNPELYAAAVRGVTDEGANVINLGLITTDMLYFAAGVKNLPGFSLTASHNPPEYSGLKMIQAGAVALSKDSGLHAIRDLAIQLVEQPEPAAAVKGSVSDFDLLPSYIDHILSFIDGSAIKPTKIVANTMFGVASTVMTALAAKLPLELMPLNFEIDGTYPKGSPNPMIPHLRQETTDLVKASNVAFGVAWDGDADRVFFWDEHGEFIEGYFTGVLLADSLLKKAAAPGEKVLHCVRLSWLFDDVATAAAGVPMECKTGHGFIKEMMRAEHALFAEEMSGHYYFRDNYYADNGMIPFLLVLEMLSTSGQSLSQIMAGYYEKIVISGEINFRVDDVQRVVAKITEQYRGQAEPNTLDGVTMEFTDWRFNVRGSNNEPLLRLNVEGRSKAVVDEKTQELKDLIGFPPVKE